MKKGAENRKKTIIAGALIMGALLCVIYAYTALFGGDTPAAPPAPPVIKSTNVPLAASANEPPASSASAGGSSQATPAVAPIAAPGVAATKLASTSAGLDPTLDQAAMLRTESLVYSGAGRNIFSATYTPPPTSLPTHMPPPRPLFQPPPTPTGPPPTPPPPPINLKFFGTAKRGNGSMQAFVLSGEDVYLASEGDIVVRKYKVINITASSIRVTDLQNGNTQTLPLQAN